MSTDPASSPPVTADERLEAQASPPTVTIASTHEAPHFARVNPQATTHIVDGHELAAPAGLECTGDVAPGAEAVESRFVELFYLAHPNRIGLRFEGLPDIYVPDLDAHRLALAVSTGGESQIESGDEYRARIKAATRARSGPTPGDDGHERFTPRTEVSEVGPASFYAVTTGDRLDRIGRADGHRHFNGRLLLTADDFPTTEEFELYRIGADAMPTDWPMIPGSYEVALIRACAAMVSAGINRHEARMAPAGDDLGLSTPPADAGRGAGSGCPSPLVQRLEDMANRAAQIMIWSRSEKGVVVEQIREFVREVAELLPAAAEKYAILAGLKASQARRDELGGGTCRSILRDALQAPLDDTRTDAQLARDLVDRIKQGAKERLEAQHKDLDRLLGPPSPVLDAIAEYRRASQAWAGAKGEEAGRLYPAVEAAEAALLNAAQKGDI